MGVATMEPDTSSAAASAGEGVSAGAASPPPPHPLTAVPVEPVSGGGAWPPGGPGGVWLMGAHGGAGVSTLAAAGLGGDAGRAWPRVPALPAGILVVARVSATGMAAAARAVEVWQSGKAPPGLHLFGLVAVAAGPRRVPAVARDRLDLVSGWVRRVWQIPWVPSLLGVDLAEVADHGPLRTAIPADLYQWLTGRPR